MRREKTSVVEKKFDTQQLILKLSLQSLAANTIFFPTFWLNPIHFKMYTIIEKTNTNYRTKYKHLN